MTSERLKQMSESYLRKLSRKPDITQREFVPDVLEQMDIFEERISDLETKVSLLQRKVNELEYPEVK